MTVEEEEERVGKESATFCSDCETIDIAMCGVVSVIIWDGATVGREKRWRARAAAAAAAAVGGTTVIFRDSNRSTPSSGITRLRRMNSQLGDLSSVARRCLILFRS